MVDGSVLGNAINHGSAEPLKAAGPTLRDGAPKRPGNSGHYTTPAASGPYAKSRPELLYAAMVPTTDESDLKGRGTLPHGMV